MSRRVAIGLGVAVALAAAAYFVLRPSRVEPENGGEVRIAAAPAPARTEAPGAADFRAFNDALRQRLRAASALTDEERQVVDGLLSQLRGRFDEPRMRLGFLEQLVAWLEQRYPETWRAELERILRAAFPAEADALLALWGQREGFEGWMRENRVDVARMSHGDRRDAMWAARRRFFGEDADRIFASVSRNERIEDALEEIDANPTGTVPDRFGQYMRAIEREYGTGTRTYLEQRRQELLDKFVSLNSVQADLSAMDRDARYAALREMRQQSGMDRDALARWDQLDRTRDTRWDQGLAYMQERERLARRYSGPALESQLAPIRARYFGAEAETIANEEAGGYFRFRETRTFGMN
ncbi:MAG: hypothetical protein U0230_24660 [Polyangiales bacterium]